jgi:hypothetical protein
MAIDGQDGKAQFRDAAQRNRAKVEAAIRRIMKVGSSQVPALNASLLLSQVRSSNRSIPSDTAHIKLVDDIVRTNGWQYRPKPKS